MCVCRQRPCVRATYVQMCYCAAVTLATHQQHTKMYLCSCVRCTAVLQSPLITAAGITSDFTAAAARNLMCVSSSALCVVGIAHVDARLSSLPPCLSRLPAADAAWRAPVTCYWAPGWQGEHPQHSTAQDNALHRSSVWHSTS